MRNVKTTACRFAVATLFALAASAAPAQQAYRIHVDGLACPFCAYGIEKKLAAIEGVERVDTDIASGTVSVTMAKGATLDEAIADQAVRAAGFSLRRFEALEGAGAEAIGGRAR